MVEGYHLHIGGGWGEQQQVARLLFSSLTVPKVHDAIRGLLKEYQRLRQTDESFNNFVARFSMMNSDKWLVQVCKHRCSLNCSQTCIHR